MSIIKPFFNKTSNKTRGIGIFLVLLIMTIISCPSADSDSGSSSSSGGGSGDSVPLVAVSVELIAGGSATGTDNGTGKDAKFNYPQGMAVDTDGNIYVADFLNHSIRKVTPAGVATTYAGLLGTAGTDDSAANNIPQARFTKPMDVLLKDADTFYVLDDKGIRQIVKNTAAVSTFATRSEASIGSTQGLLRSIIRKPNTDIFYIIDPNDAGGTSYFNRIVENPSGKTFHVLINFERRPYSTVASNGTLSIAHRFSDAVFDSDGNMYVSTGSRGHSIITFNPSTAERHTTGTHANAIKEVAFFVGDVSGTSGNTNGVGTDAMFNEPRGMLIRGDYIYVADSENHIIRMVQISTKTVSTLVGLGTAGQVNGGKDVATFNKPHDIEFAPNGDIIVSEEHAIRRIVVQK